MQVEDYSLGMMQYISNEINEKGHMTMPEMINIYMICYEEAYKTEQGHELSLLGHRRVRDQARPFLLNIVKRSPNVEYIEKQDLVRKKLVKLL